MSDIARLFATDPLRHSEADIDAIIEHFRASRANFKLTGKAPAKLSKREAEAEKSGLNLDIDLSSL